MKRLRRAWIICVSAAALLLGSIQVRAAGSCTAYPTTATDTIKSTVLDSTFDAVPRPTKSLHFVYVTKTLINEFWQDVAAAARDEASKQGIKLDVQAAKDEASMVEQLNLAQTVISQKPDALLLSPQSDSNLVPVINAARAANIPTVIIDDARTPGASTYIGTDQVAIGAEAATYLHEVNPHGGNIAQIEGAAGSPNARLRMRGFKEQLVTH